MSIVVERLETSLVDLPTIRPHRLAVTTMQRQTIVLVRVVCADGVVGLGEGTTIGGLAYGDESPETMQVAIETYLAPLVIGQDATAPAAVMARVRAHVRGNRFAKSAVETALLDAHARRIGVPLSELLGGRRRDRLAVAWTLASGDTSKDIAEAEHMLELRRHDIFKIKIGGRAVSDDVAHVAAIKRAVGSRASVRADVNMAWSESEAARGIPALADAGCDLVEQPVPSAAALARLVRRWPLAIMADEVLQGPATAFELAKVAGADVFSVKLGPSGGPTEATRVAAIADAAGIELYGGTMLEGGVGTAASAHVFSTFAALPWGTELFGPLLLTEELLATPLAYRDYHLVVPTGPGLGIELDHDRVNARTRR